MHLSFFLRAALSAALTLTAQVAAAAQPTDAVVISYIGVPDAQVELFERSLDRFSDAGLALPPIDVVGHRDRDACLGRRGIHRYEHGRSSIGLCTPEAGPDVEFMILHELAHAWDRKSLTPVRRDAFLQLRGLREWRNDDVDRWHERGAEHAAEIMAWALSDRPVRVGRLEANSCTDLLVGYLVLTGAEPLRGHDDLCRADGP